MLPGLHNTKMNGILFLLIKSDLSYWRKINKMSFKANLRSRPCSKMLNGFLFLGINLNSSASILKSLNIWLHYPNSILNILFAPMIKLFLINRNIFFLTFSPYYWYLIMLRRQTFLFWSL